MRVKEMKPNAKRVAIVACVVLAIVAVFAIISTIFSSKDSVEVDPALARAMTYDKVESGDEDVDNCDYVQFDAFFLQDLDGDGYAEGVRGTCKEVNSTATLYIDLNVLTNGYLTDGQITIYGDNMTLATSIVSDSVVNGNYISSNTTSISLNDVNNGTEKLLYGTVSANIGNNTSKYSSSLNYIKLTGTHVAEDGTETKIEKTVYFTCDWYGYVGDAFYYTASKYSQKTTSLSDVLNYDEDEINLTFYVRTYDTVNELLLESSNIYGTIPSLNGYMPTEVTIEGTNVTYTYDEESGEFTATRQAVTDSNGNITAQAYSTTYYNNKANMYTINVTYPLEAYTSMGGTETIELLVPVYSYYTAYNNDNDEFDNPITSNIASTSFSLLWRNPTGYTVNFDVYVGTYRSYDNKYVVSKKEAKAKYEDETYEANDTYIVRWYAYTGEAGSTIDSLIMSENNTNAGYTVDQYGATSTYYTTDGISSNIGIYFSGATNMLGEDGYIYVYDADTDELLVTFTNDGRDDTLNWNSYNSSSPYYYSQSVRRIKVTTSEASQNSSLTVYHVKEFDDDVLIDTYDEIHLIHL